MNNVCFFIVASYFLISGLSVCKINISSPISEIFNIILFFIGIIWLLKNKLILDKYYKIIILGFFLPKILSFINSFINVFFLDSIYREIFFIGTIGRKINIVIFFIIFSFLNSYVLILKRKELKKLLNYYITGIFILFIFFGIWQFLSNYFNIPIFEIKSRTYIHSVSNIASFIKLRITGLANEPSYIAPFLIDSIIICWILKYKKIFILSLVCLLLTYSGGGYINIFILFTIYLFCPKIISKKNQIKILFSIIIILIFLLITKIDVFFKVFSPVLNRFNSQTNLLDLSYNIRTYMVIMPFIWILEEYNILSTFFGMGVGGYKYLALTKYFKNRNIHATSNNIFSDFVYETGYFGFFSLCLMFFLLFKNLFKNLKNNDNRYNKGNILLLFHLIISSLYRADFMSSRFWIILIIIKINIFLGKKEKVYIIEQKQV